MIGRRAALQLAGRGVRSWEGRRDLRRALADADNSTLRMLWTTTRGAGSLSPEVVLNDAAGAELWRRGAGLT